MARIYTFLFRAQATYDSVQIEGHGNTRRSAEQHARRRLRDDHKKDPTKFYTAKVTFAGRS